MTINAPSSESHAPEPGDILAKGRSGPDMRAAEAPACQRMTRIRAREMDAEAIVRECLFLRPDETNEAPTSPAITASGVILKAVKTDTPWGGDIRVSLIMRKGRRERASNINSEPAIMTLSRPSGVTGSPPLCLSIYPVRPYLIKPLERRWSSATRAGSCPSTAILPLSVWRVTRSSPSNTGFRISAMTGLLSRVPFRMIGAGS